MCRSDGWIGLSSTRTSASPWAKGGVGISASFNTLFGSPVSLKINALIDTPWPLGDGPVLRLREQEVELVMNKNISVETWETLHPFARPLYSLSAWAKLFVATRSKRKFNNPVSFDEE